MSVSNSPFAVLHGEWIKIRTVRSTLLSLAVAVVASVGLGILNGSSVRSALDAKSDMVRPDFDPINSGFVGVQFGQLALIAFGVLLVCSEYTSGTVRAALGAVPGRGLLYAGKITVAALVALAVAAVTVLIAFVATQRALGPYGVTLGQGESVRAVVGAPLYLALLCLLAVGVGMMLRSSALALTVMFVFVFVLSPVASSVPGLREVARYLPDQAGAQIMKVGAQADPVVGPVAGLLILLAWTVAALAGGYAVLARRDA
ncbi:ABC-2 family transporter [Herbihabitans rhizosphaerae]|uniref:ABC-2 family transporter n=1 Tax=Herbihabitans rhizosphaerae TaxID=1872711 RepID=A0A4Q7KJC9_9PSEU|nr:ABC transporter permease subunit [Herbihabitans rhizosphaerae]RZS33976.1 ABC-2 family transporter [Herbihabitans rhizosphaerae]